MAASGGGGGGASSGAIKAGKGYVELGVDDRGFKASLSKVAAGFKGLSGVLKSAGGAFVGAGTTVGAGFVGAFKAAIDRGQIAKAISKDKEKEFKLLEGIIAAVNGLDLRLSVS